MHISEIISPENITKIKVGDIYKATHPKYLVPRSTNPPRYIERELILIVVNIDLTGGPLSHHIIKREHQKYVEFKILMDNINQYDNQRSIVGSNFTNTAFYINWDFQRLED